MKKLLYISILFALLAGCSSGETVDDTDQGKRISVAATPSLDCLPFYIAQEIGIADSMGYDLRINVLTALNDCDTALIGGSADAILSDYVHADKLKQKADSFAVYPHENCQLYLFTNTKARIKEASQLKDKMIAGDRKGLDCQVAEHVLDSVKLSGDKAFIVNILNIRLRLKMLLNNEVDAAILPEPQATVARMKGNKSIYLIDHFKERPIGSLVARRNADKVMKIYNAACDSLNKNGIHHYDSVLIKRYNIQKQMLNSIPKRTFKHISNKSNS